MTAVTDNAMALAGVADTYFHRRRRPASPPIQTVVVDGNKGQDGFCDIIQAIHTASTAELTALNTTGQTLQTALNQDSTAILRGLADGTADAIDATHQASVGINDRITQHGLSLGDKIQATEARVQQTLGQGFRDIAKESCDTRDAVRTSANTTDREVLENRSVIRDAACTVERVVQAGFGDTRRELAKEAGDIRLENYRAEGRTRELVFQTSHQAQLDACKNTDAIQRAIELAAREAAECCCEVKELIRATTAQTELLLVKQSADTKELFLKQENQRLLERLAACEASGTNQKIDLLFGLLTGKNGNGLIKVA